MDSGEEVCRFWPEAQSEKQVTSCEVPRDSFNLKLKSDVLAPQKGPFGGWEGECGQAEGKRRDPLSRYIKRIPPSSPDESMAQPGTCVHLFAWNFHPEICPPGIKPVNNPDLLAEALIAG